MANSEVGRKYIANNDEILLMVESWQQAVGLSKNRLGGKIMKRLKYLVCSKIRRHKGLPIYDDLLQEGSIGIMEALQGFDLLRGRNFFQYVTWHIQTKVRRCLSKETRHRFEVPMGHPGSSGDDLALSPHDEMEILEGKAAVRKAVSGLSVKDRRVLRMRFGLEDGEIHTFRQIGQELGVTRQRAEQLETLALSRLSSDGEVRQQFFCD